MKIFFVLCFLTSLGGSSLELENVEKEKRINFFTFYRVIVDTNLMQ